MYTKIKSDIAGLSDKIFTLMERAKTENRPLNAKEAGWIAEAEIEIDDLRKQLPANSPLSFQGPRRATAASGNGPYKSLGEQLIDVRAAGTPGGQTNPRLFQAAATGAGETVPSDGGFLVQSDFNNELLQDLFENGIIAPRCMRFPVSGNSNGIAINGFDETSRASTRFGGIVAYWEGEGDQYTGKKPKFRQINLKLKKLTGLCYATDESLADAAALEVAIRTAFTSEFRFQLDDAIINGDGSGKPLGILNAACLVTVAKETGQTAKTILAENIVKMYSRLVPGSERTAVILANRDALPQFYTMSLSVGTGGAPIFMPAGGISGRPYDSVLGLPIVISEHCATLGTVGDVILADFPRGYVLADKGGIQSAVSIHVRFEYGEQVFRFTLRVDGAPALASAITPYKGTDTLSHFVALATRS